MVLSGLLELRHSTEGNGPGAGATIIATVIAFVVGYASIALLLKFLTSHSTRVFVVYRVVLARSCSCWRRPGPSPDARDRRRAGRGAGVGDLGAACDNRSTRADRRRCRRSPGCRSSASSVVLPFAVYEGVPSQPSGDAIAWIVVGGVGVIVGLTLLVRGDRPRRGLGGRAGHGDRRRAGRARERRARRAHRGRDRRRPRSSSSPACSSCCYATAAQERPASTGHSLAAVLLAGGAACGFGALPARRDPRRRRLRRRPAAADLPRRAVRRDRAPAALPRASSAGPGKAWTFVTAAAVLQTAGFVLYRVAGRSGDVADPVGALLAVRGVRDHRRRARARRAPQPSSDRRPRRAS